MRIGELRLKNVSCETALRYICERNGLRYTINEYGITFSPLREAGAIPCDERNSEENAAAKRVNPA